MPGFRCLVVSLLFTIVGIAVGLSVYFFAFDKDDPQPTALCGSCHCITGSDGTCPKTAPKQPSSIGTSLVDQFSAQVPTNPFNLTCNPYEDPTCSTSPSQQYSELGESAVCALLYEQASVEGECPTTYQMITYPNRSLADSSGAMITHVGPCGVCSTTQDLAAYLRSQDLTTAAKECSKRAFLDELLDETGSDRFGDAVDEGMDCFINDLGMTESCARIWLHNAWNTGKECGVPCLAADVADFQNNGPSPECKLNQCLRCDEEESGDIFKRVAGRTRRRSGLLSAIARPCEDLHIVDHVPCPTNISTVV